MRSSRAAVLLVVALAGATLPSGATTATAGCSNVPVVGPACRTPDGLYRLTLPGGRVLYTHGGDRIDPVAATSARYTSSTAYKPACTDNPDTEFHIEIIYAHAKDTPSRYTKLRSEIQRIAEQANSIFAGEAARMHRSMALRFYCTGGTPVIPQVTLPTPVHETSFYSVARDLTQLGYTNPMVKNWVWFDGRMGGVLGTGNFYSDDRLTPGNVNMRQNGFAVTWGVRQIEGAAAVMLHEGSHNFGGVQLSAPHTTGAAHCIDGRDIMCYPDGGPFQSYYRETFCQTRVWYDCGHNDYFNPVPAARSYLATHWNIGSPFDVYAQGCTYRTGPLTVGLAGQDPEQSLPKTTVPVGPQAARSAGLSKSCWGHAWGISGISQNLPAPLDQTQQYVDGPPAAVAPAFEACFLKGSTTMTCSGTADHGTVPSGATGVRVVMTRGARGIYVFNAV